MYPVDGGVEGHTSAVVYSVDGGVDGQISAVSKAVLLGAISAVSYSVGMVRIDGVGVPGGDCAE